MNKVNHFKEFWEIPLYHKLEISLIVMSNYPITPALSQKLRIYGYVRNRGITLEPFGRVHLNVIVVMWSKFYLYNLKTVRWRFHKQTLNRWTFQPPADFSIFN